MSRTAALILVYTHVVRELAGRARATTCWPAGAWLSCWDSIVAIHFPGVCHNKHGPEAWAQPPETSGHKDHKGHKIKWQSKQTEAQLFMELMDKEFQELVSSAALTNLSERKFNKVKTLPTSGDLQKLSDFLLSGLKATVSSTGIVKPHCGWSLITTKKTKPQHSTGNDDTCIWLHVSVKSSRQ